MPFFRTTKSLHSGPPPAISYEFLPFPGGREPPGKGGMLVDIAGGGVNYGEPIPFRRLALLAPRVISAWDAHDGPPAADA